MQVVKHLPRHEHVFNQPTRISQAPLWDWQNHAYQQSPQNIWRSVPWWLSSNRLHAEHYAKLCCQYIHDLVAQKKLSAGQPIYIIDMGAGYGSLSALLIDCLAKEKETQSLQAYPTHHLLVDMNPHAITHWQTIPQLQHHGTTHQVDYMICHIDQLSSAYLHHQKIPLSQVLQQHPALLIGHYLLDALRCDFFYRDHAQQNHLMQCTLSTRQDNLLHQQQPKDLAKVHLTYQTTPLGETTYPEAELNVLLADHLSTQPNGSYTSFPCMALRMLSFFKQHAQQGLLVCLQDKGSWSQHSQQDLTSELHGNALSYMVHFGVLNRYLQPWRLVRTATTPASLQAVCAIHAAPETSFHHTTTMLEQLYAIEERNKLSLPTNKDYLSWPDSNHQHATVSSFIDNQTMIETLAHDPTIIYLSLRYHLNVLAKAPMLTMSLLEKMTACIPSIPQPQPYNELATQAYWRLNQPQMTRQYFEKMDIEHQYTLANLKAAIWCYKKTDNLAQSQHHLHLYIKQRTKHSWQTLAHNTQRFVHFIKRYTLLFASATAMIYFFTHLRLIF